MGCSFSLTSQTSRVSAHKGRALTAHSVQLSLLLRRCHHRSRVGDRVVLVNAARQVHHTRRPLRLVTEAKESRDGRRTRALAALNRESVASAAMSFPESTHRQSLVEAVACWRRHSTHLRM